MQRAAARLRLYNFTLHTLLLQYYEICYNADIRFRKDTYV